MIYENCVMSVVFFCVHRFPIINKKNTAFNQTKYTKVGYRKYLSTIILHFIKLKNNRILTLLFISVFILFREYICFILYQILIRDLKNNLFFFPIRKHLSRNRLKQEISLKWEYCTSSGSFAVINQSDDVICFRSFVVC